MIIYEYRKRNRNKRLKLLPGVNKRDSKPFLKMLREDGNFQEFCGVEFSEKTCLSLQRILKELGMKNVSIPFSKRFYGEIYWLCRLSS